MTYLETLRQEIETRYPKAFAEQLDISGKATLGIDQTDLEAFKQILPILRQFTVEDFEKLRQLANEKKITQ